MGAWRRRKARLPEAPRLVVVEVGSVSDVLAATPVLRAIRNRHPNAEVTVMAAPGPAMVLVGNPHMDRIAALTRAQRAGLGGFVRMSAWLRSKRFDAALLLGSGLGEAVAAAAAGVPIRAGLASASGRIFLTHRADPGDHSEEPDRRLRVLSLLGIPSDGKQLEIFLTDEEREEAAQLLSDAITRRLIVLDTGPGSAGRSWPIERHAELAALLAREHGLLSVCLCGPDAGSLNERLADSGVERPRVVAPRNVRIAAALLERAHAVVTSSPSSSALASTVGSTLIRCHPETTVEAVGAAVAEIAAQSAPSGRVYLPSDGARRDRD